MHSDWSTTVAPGFSSPLESPRGPSEGLHHRCRTAPACTELPWPTDSEHCLWSIGELLPQSIEVFVIYLQSIGGLELVDNHSSHQESNEAVPLALSSLTVHLPRARLCPGREEEERRRYVIKSKCVELHQTMVSRRSTKTQA
ncbi:hypothetical protein U9M48_028053 [Paspalum notatum var. saurae]|uniref:Uncharacterized protein n=1 Tax=Paspalum notatum var. saurae TaxID=547442 RepID=A0AAQ3X132_PASNO